MMRTGVKQIILLLAGLSGLWGQEKQVDWEVAPSLLHARYGAPALVLNHNIYIFGGNGINGVTLGSVEVFDSLSNTWQDTVVQDMPTPRVNASAAVYDGLVYLIGGRDNMGNVLASVDIYDPLANQWSAGPDLQTVREGHFAASLNSRLFVIGGIDEGGDYLSGIEWFTSLANQWDTSPTLFVSERAVPFRAVHNNLLYFFGGVFISPLRSSYRAQGNGNGLLWTPLPPLAEGRANGATGVIRDKIYLAGGTTAGGASSTTEVYDIGSGSITSTTNLPTGRIGCSGSVLGGVLYVIGGYTSDPVQPTTRVETLQPDLVAIEPAPGVPTAIALLKGYPNPFNGSVAIQVSLHKAVTTRLTVYSIQGKYITSLFNGKLTAGEHVFVWDTGSDNYANASGIYLAVLQTPAGQIATRLVYIQ